MKISKFIKSRVAITLLLGIAALGSTFFLPMNLGGSYTCMYHRLLNSDHPVIHDSENMASIGGVGITQISAEKNLSNDTEEHGQELLDMYLRHYAFLWWGSLGLAAFCLYRFGLFSKSKKADPNNMEEIR